jgi:YesN/AraC family two-component response regulator
MTSIQDKIASIKKFKILFVEDEKDLQTIVSGTFSKIGFDFLVAGDGKEALEIISKDKEISLLITDINMPIMNGLDLIKEAKKISPSMKVIIMSAHNEEEFVRKASDLGVDDYLIKPFDFMKFIDIAANYDKVN